MGVRVRLSRNSSMYVPFIVAIPVYVIWVAVMAVVAVVWVLVKLVTLSVTGIAALVDRRTLRQSDGLDHSNALTRWSAGRWAGRRAASKPIAPAAPEPEPPAPPGTPDGHR